MALIFTTLLALFTLRSHGLQSDSGPEQLHHGHHGRARPNFILIMTDDQDLHLNSLSYQPAVQKHFIEKGTWLQKHFCTVSLCCPSRVSLLTGQAAHNTNITDVFPPYGGYPRFVERGYNDNYLPVWLQQAGYKTYYTGKLMNAHSINTYNEPFAAGWTRSDFLLDPGTYIYNNASMALDNGPYAFLPGKYSTDLVANRSVEFLGNAIDSGEPFFLGVTPIGPHAETIGGVFKTPVPAERHKHLFPNARVPRSPSFNVASQGAVHYFKNLPELTAEQIEYADDYYRRRLQALQAVDDLVDGIFAKLEAHPKVLANTYVIYTSDNGYHIGQHRLPPGKTCGIEEDVNVPFIIRGPGIPAGHTERFPTSHTDLTPTIFELAGIPQRADFDGEPIPLRKGHCNRRSTKREHVNIEFWGSGLAEGTVFESLGDTFAENTYKTLRVVAEDYDFMYTVWCNNEHELYDIKVDPFQLHNLYGQNTTTSKFSIPELSARLDTLLLTLKACKGDVCRRPWNTVFPAGNVTSLADALDPTYDEFFARDQARVTFSACSPGQILANEGSLTPVAFGSEKAFEARWEDWT